MSPAPARASRRGDLGRSPGALLCGRRMTGCAVLWLAAALRGGTRAVALAAACHALLLLLGTPARALDPAKSIFQFNCQSWTRQNGLPGDKVNSIVQSDDGYLWLGMQNGLVRFDGLEFKVRPVDLAQARGQEIRRLVRANDGGLWFSIEQGGVGHFDGARFRPAANAALGDQTENAQCVFQDGHGVLWAGTDVGLHRWTENGESAPTMDRMIGAVFAVADGRDGVTWVGTVDHGLWRIDRAGPRPVGDARMRTRSVMAVAVDREDRVWAATTDGVRCYDPAGQPVPVAAGDLEAKAILVDRHGTVWIGTSGGGLGRYQGGKLTYLRKADGLSGDVVTSLWEDAEGSIWVGCTEGLTQLSDVKFPIYSGRDGLADGGAVAVAASPRGGVWITTALGASYFDGKAFTTYTEFGGSRYIRRVLEASNGDVYFCDGDKNILIYRGGRQIAKIATESWPESFAEDEQGVVVGIGAKLHVISDGRLKPYVFQSAAPDFYWITNLMRARDGALWVTCNHGAFRIEHGRWRNWSAAEGLSSDRGTGLWEDPDGAVWLTLGSGLARIKGDQVVNVRMKDGLFDDRIYAAVADDGGYYWMASGRGYFRVARQKLNDFADGRSTTIVCEPFDGLNSVRFADRDDQGYYGCKAADGTIWFPTPHGVLRIDPVGFVRNTVPPPVHVDRVLVNGKERSFPGAPQLEVGDRRVEFFFSALSFVLPRRVVVRYRLAGLDDRWTDAGERRSARFENLAPGRYRFEVQAANADGVWNREGAVFAFELPPPFYQRWWFHALVGAGGLGLLVLAARWNTRKIERSRRQLQAQNEMLERHVAERTDALARSLAQLRATLDATAEGILALQIAGGEVNGISCNAQFVAMWRLPEDTLQSGAAAVRDYLAAQVQESERFRQRMMQLAATPGAEAEDHLTLQDGRVFEWHCRPQRIDGRIVGLVVDVRDVTARRRAEAELAYERDLLRALMDSATDAICFKDRESRFLKVSQARARHCGLATPDLLVGRTDFAIFTAAHAQETLADEQEVLRTGRALVGKIERETWADGRETWALTSRIPLRDHSGAIIGTIGISKDITELKLAEAKLEHVHRQLLDTSRQAGMAEVATSVLHNVGNALTSVNVSATFVAELARRSKVSYLPKLSTVLEEHAGDLVEFLTNDPKGRKLPTFIADLARELMAEQAAQLEELARLTEHIDHIKNIVAMQQTYAKIAGVSETVKVTQIIEDAIRMNSSALTRHQIDLVREFPFEPVLTIERHKVLQVLVNLISNAKYACDESGRPDKRIVVRTEPTAIGVAIKVIDNGVGIAPENLTRIFGHGFTTKRDGHGFALHSGSLLAVELGGELRVESGGPGTGATFTLELPLHPPAPKP